MMEFQFVGFTPREEFKKQANLKIKEIAELMPSDAHCSARVVMIDHKFFFQVMFVSKTECFIAREVLDPTAEDTSSRAWQVAGIDKVMTDLSYQIYAWRDTRAA